MKNIPSKIKQYGLASKTQNSFNPIDEKYDIAGVSGVSAQKFRKGVLTTGTYCHPNDNWSWDVTDNVLKKLAKNTNELVDSGRKIPVLKSHKFIDESAGEQFESDLLLGYADSFDIDDDGWLSPVFEFRGEEAQEIAIKNGQVSIGYEKSYNATDGKTYKDVITHLAITPVPVVGNQKEFERLAASLTNTGDIPVLCLDTKENKMDNIKNIMTELFPDTEVADEQMLDFIKDQIKASRKEKDDAKSKLTLSETKVKELEAKIIVETPSDVISERANLYEERIDTLIDKAILSKKDATELKTLVLGVESNRNEYSLSTRESEVTWAKKIIDWVENLGPKLELGTKTGSQSATLDDTIQEEKDFDEDVYNELLGYAGISTGAKNG